MNSRLALAWGILVVFATAPGAGAEHPSWHPTFYLPGEGCWQGRIRVSVHNNTDGPLAGRPVAVGVGGDDGQARLVGERAEAIRVCDRAGTELLFAVVNANGEMIRSGPVPDDSRLIIPVECPAWSSRDYFVYFDNPSAGLVPDFLPARTGLVNGDVEQGRGAQPIDWQHDVGDAEHRATWSDEQPQSGRRCLKTVVSPGAEPTWIATRQSQILIDGGTRYRMTAWVRAENVVGDAGWYIHVGSEQQPMILAPMLRGGGGSYPWKQVSAEFTAPANATRADLGTVLRGTGTAWFDNVTLTRTTAASIRAVADRPERIAMGRVGDEAPWPDTFGPHGGWQRRAKVKLFNPSSEAIEGGLVCIDLTAVARRCRGQLRRDSIRVSLAGSDLPHMLLGDQIVFPHDVPPRSACTFYIYFATSATATPLPQAPDAGLDIKLGANRGDALRDGSSAPNLLTGAWNLVQNPSFEEGRPLPEQWTASATPTEAPRIQLTADAPGAPGCRQHCAKLAVLPGVEPAWRGWQQRVPVEGGATYLYAAWVRSQDLGGPALLHAHVKDGDGRLCGESPMRSAGPQIDGTTGWTHMSARLPMPPDAATLDLHLTMNTSGTLWHDGVVVAKVTTGRVVGFEGRPVEPAAGVRLWPVNAIVKLFPDDPAPESATAAEISVARDEWEPLQLAIRSGTPRERIRVAVDAPRGPQGASLNDITVNVVGYVPIDYPTSYYRSESPRWHRKFPTHRPGCDGWAGPWPDPLLPVDSMDLPANKTQAVWVTVKAGPGTPAGEYVSRVRLMHEQQPLAELPLRVRVWDFDLPRDAHLAAIYDVRTGPGREHWGQGFDQLYPRIVRFLAQRRLCADRIVPDPKIEYREGRVVADFSEFDAAAAHYFDTLGLPRAYTPQLFYLFGWGHPPKRFFGLDPYPGTWPYEGADRSQLEAEYKQAYQACLKAFWDHVRQKGWAERFVLYISDEPHDHQGGIVPQMQALCDMIHEVDSSIPIYSSTWKHVPEWDGYLDVWGIGHDGRVPVAEMAQMQARGDRLWFTTDGQMCTDTPYCAVERLLPHYCFRYGVEAYEFWGVSWLTYNPYQCGWHAYIHQSSRPGTEFFVRYPNGDGFLLYPGHPLGHDGPVSTIRLEQAREGAEDYAYLVLLRRLAEQAAAAGRDVTAARAALERASQLVAIPNAGGRYSSRILTDPDAVLHVRRAVAEAIEQLIR